MRNYLKNKDAFTLIELVIVLAIAALILAGVLLAVTGAQQSQRDSKRRQDAGIVGALLQESAGNHNGVYPAQAGGATAAAFNTQAGAKVTAPNGTYTISQAGTVGTCPTAALGQNVIQWQTTANRTWQVAAGLESGDNYCTTGQ